MQIVLNVFCSKCWTLANREITQWTHQTEQRTPMIRTWRFSNEMQKWTMTCNNYRIHHTFGRIFLFSNGFVHSFYTIAQNRKMTKAFNSVSNTRLGMRAFCTRKNSIESNGTHKSHTNWNSDFLFGSCQWSMACFSLHLSLTRYGNDFLNFVWCKNGNAACESSDDDLPNTTYVSCACLSNVSFPFAHMHLYSMCARMLEILKLV